MGLSADFLQLASTQITNHLCDWDLFQRASVICLFTPLAGEPDLLRLVAREQDRHRFAFPRVCSDQQLQLYIVTDRTEFVTNRFGIAEPRLSHEQVSLSAIDLMLIPALALDQAGNRLGFGKGYYDRLLAGYSGIKAGVVFAEQIMTKIPCEAHDKAVDFIVTEEGITKADHSK